MGFIGQWWARLDQPVLGEIVEGDRPPEGWGVGTRYLKFSVTATEALAVQAAIANSIAASPTYQLKKHNCSTWASEMLDVVPKAHDQFRAYPHSPIVTPKDLLDALGLIGDSQEHPQGEEAPVWQFPS